MVNLIIKRDPVDIKVLYFQRRGKDFFTGPLVHDHRVSRLSYFPFNARTTSLQYSSGGQDGLRFVPGTTQEVKEVKL